MKTLLLALKAQLEADATLATYASDSGYIAKDSYTLVQYDKFPFFNLFPLGIRYERVTEVSFKEMNRKILPVRIDLACKNMNLDVSMLGDANNTGLLDFIDNIWSAIIADRTVGNSVNGVMPEFNVVTDTLQLEDDDRSFVSASEMIVEFYRDVAL